MTQGATLGGAVDNTATLSVTDCRFDLLGPIADPILTTNQACKAGGVQELHGRCNLCRVSVLVTSE